MEHLSSTERILLLLLLLGWCNFLPILARFVFRDYLALPLDFGKTLKDGRPVFGPHKTWRGLVCALAGTGLAGTLTPLGPVLALEIAFLSMTGDLLASFAKRRMRFPSGAKALGLDQVPETLIPLWGLQEVLAIDWLEIIVLVATFTGVELLVSPVLYHLHIRRNPH